MVWESVAVGSEKEPTEMWEDYYGLIEIIKYVNKRDKGMKVWQTGNVCDLHTS